MKKVKIINAMILASSLFSCSTGNINSTPIKNDMTQTSLSMSKSDLKTFGVKFSSNFNAEAYRLTYQDIRDAIKNKTIPDSFYHHFYSQVSEPNRLTNPTYLEVKSRLESGEFSEDAYLIANPDVKAAIDAGTIASGYQHWYSYAITNEPTRKSKQEYLDAKSAVDAGFNEKAYRMVHTDIDNLVKTNALPSAYAHYNTWAKNNETIRVTSTRYVQIKNAILQGYDENAYLLAYPDIKAGVDSGFFPKAIDHYINYGVNETRLEREIYQAAKLAIVNDFDEQRYRTAYPNVVTGINLFWFPTAFEHFRRYGRYEGLLTRQVYLDTKSPEFRISTATINSQNSPKVASNSNGNFVTVWAGEGTGDDFGIFAQRYNSNGETVGSNFLVNNYVTGVQVDPSVAIDPSGNFVIVWQGQGVTDVSGINARKFNSDGTPQANQFTVNNLTSGFQQKPVVSIDPSGNFVTAWQGEGEGDVYGIHARRFNSLGGSQPQFRVNTLTGNNQLFPSISASPTGNFVITWEGNPNFVVAGKDIYAQRYDSNGSVVDSNFLVNNYTVNDQGFPSVSINSSNDFVISWNGEGMGDTAGIFARRFTSAGVANGSEFMVNNYTTGNQNQSNISMDSTGGFVATWSGEGMGDGVGIFGQKFTSTGVVNGSEFMVNTYTINNQQVPSISTSSAGNFVVVWQSNLQDGSDLGVFGKKYTNP